MSARVTFMINKYQRTSLSEKQEHSREADDVEMEKKSRELSLIPLLQKKPTAHMRKRYKQAKTYIQDEINYAHNRIGQPIMDEYAWTYLHLDASNEEEYIELYIGHYINLLRFYRKYPRLLNTHTEWLDICNHLDRWYQIRETTSIVTNVKRYKEMMFCYDLAKKDAQYCIMYYKWFLALVLSRIPLLDDVKPMIMSFLM